MGAAMGIGLASMGNAFMKSYLDATERNRRQKIEDEDRAWREEEREAQRQERAEKTQLKRDIIDAALPRTTMAGTVTQSDAGQVFSATPENAQAMQDTLAAEADLRGSAAPTQQAGHAVTGSMSRGHQIAVGAAPQNDVNSPDARIERMLEAYRKNGQWDKALEMENAIMDQKAKRLGLKISEYDYLDKQANRELVERLQSKPNWWDGAADFVSNSKFGPLKDTKAQAVLSEDGKTVELFAINKDGQRISTGVYPANDQGMVMFMEKAGKVDLSLRLSMLRDERKRAEERADKDRDFKMKENESSAKADYYRSAAGAKDATAQSNGIKLSEPDEIFLRQIGDQRKTINSAIIKAQAEGTYDPKSPSARSLQTQLGTLALRERQILSRYQTSSAPLADPLGKRGAPAASTSGPATVPAPSTGARVSDQLAILQNELVAAQGRLAAGDSRAQADIQALQVEIKRAGGVVAPMAAATAPASVAPAPASQPVAPMSQATRPAPPVPPAPAARVDPLAGKSRQEIREIKADLQKERKRWADEPNAARRIAEIDELLARIESGRY